MNIEHQACARLSPREREALVLLSKGFSAQETGARMSLSVHTVKDYARFIRAKLDARSMLEAAVIATKAGLV